MNKHKIGGTIYSINQFNLKIENHKVSSIIINENGIMYTCDDGTQQWEVNISSSKYGLLTKIALKNEITKGM